MASMFRIWRRPAIPDLCGLPPALVYVGTLDGFCDEDVVYAMRLYQAGVATESTSAPLTE